MSRPARSTQLGSGNQQRLAQSTPQATTTAIPTDGAAWKGNDSRTIRSTVAPKFGASLQTRT